MQPCARVLEGIRLKAYQGSISTFKSHSLAWELTFGNPLQGFCVVVQALGITLFRDDTL